MRELLDKVLLKFSDSRLESDFAENYVERFVAQIQIAVGLTAVVLASDLVVDSVLYPSESTRANYIRGLIVLPCVLLAAAFSFIRSIRKYLETIFCAIILFGSSALFWALVVLDRDGGLGLTSSAGFINYVFVILLIFLLSGIRFKFAFWAGIFATFAFIAFMYVEIKTESNKFYAYSYHVFSIFILCSFLGYWREWFVRQVYHFNVKLDYERAQTESMLHEHIPERIIDALRTSTPPIAEPIGEATVIFADIQGFTSLTNQLGPEHLLEVLDQLFGAFDRATDKYKIDKVKTIGDCYMAVSPSKSGKDAAFYAIQCGEEWQKSTRKIGESLNIPLQLRIGVHTGSIIGGVIGSRRWAYDYWGNTVNIASRIQTAAEPGEILISETSYNRIRSMTGELSNKEVELRGIGKVVCYSYAI